ncbi:MAG TPA: hypothetical protein VM577_04870, partial [Anaerovoracaceae bacterium]|nr:hypothetical protein [Anaerovoracaceae bacterium]
MSNNPVKKELIAMIEPDGGYALDWQSVGHDIEKHSAEFQENMYDIYLADRDKALFMLGAVKKDVVLYETAEYLFKVTSLFVRCLSRNPDLEILREKARGVLEDKEQDELLCEAPFINGAEYLDRHWIACVWDNLNMTFSKEM